MKRLGNDKERPKLTERDKGQLNNASGNIQTFFPLTQEGLYYSESWRMLIAIKLRECEVAITLSSLSTSSKPEPELLLIIEMGPRPLGAWLHWLH